MSSLDTNVCSTITTNLLKRTLKAIWWYQPRGVGAGWAGKARANLLFSLTFIEKGHLPTHFLLPIEYFFILPTHFEEASYAPNYFYW